MTENRYLNGYLQGLADAASIASVNMGYSGINTFCFEKDSYAEDLAAIRRECGCKDKVIELYTSDLSPKEEMAQLLDNEKQAISRDIMWALSRAVGDALRVLRFEDESDEKEIASGYETGWGGFYFVEDLFFIEFEDYMVLFVIGNDE